MEVIGGGPSSFSDVTNTEAIATVLVSGASGSAVTIRGCSPGTLLEQAPAITRTRNVTTYQRRILHRTTVISMAST